MTSIMGVCEIQNQKGKKTSSKMEQIENGQSTNGLLSIKLSLVFTHFTCLSLPFNRSSVERQPKVNAKLMFKIILHL